MTCCVLFAQVSFTFVYVRKEPKLDAPILRVLKKGNLVEIYGMKGSWGRLVPIVDDENSNDPQHGDDPAGWVLTTHGEHGALLYLVEDNSIILP
jgi:hypothetical protein